MASVREKGKRRERELKERLYAQFGTTRPVRDNLKKWRPIAASVSIPAVRWVSDLAFEGVATGDGRFIVPGAVTWRDLPIPLKAMTVEGPGGHEGSFLAGKITKITRDTKVDMDGESLPEGVAAIRGHGIFDMDGENGAEVARLVGDEFMRGVSVDPGDVEVMYRDPETGQTWTAREADASVTERAMFGELQTAFSRYQIAAATVCTTPAFADARIALVAGAFRSPSILATFEIVSESLVAAAAPVAPPRAWFHVKEPAQAVPLTVTDDGRISGHIAAWGSCYLGRPGECFQPPRSPSSYAYFNLGEIVCKDGSTVACGQITMDTFHASLTPGTTWQEAKAHYEKTGICVADVRAIDGEHGIFVSGAIRPNLSAEQIRELRAAKPSGDWRQITPGGPLELIGALEVNRPGYPVPRPQLALAASAAHPEGEPVAAIALGFFDGNFVEHRLAALDARLEGRDALAALIG